MDKKELYVLSGEEIQNIVDSAASTNFEADDAMELAEKLATPLSEMDEYGYCEDCPGRRYRS